MQFVVGQRWISHTEPQLGLGVVVEAEGRRVTMDFPAADERRVYVMDNAPLSRIIYKVGDRIQNLDAQSVTVTATQEHNGLMFYQGIDAAGAEYIVDELSLNCYVQFSSPEQRLFSGQFDKNTDLELRIETLHHLHRLQQSPVRGLLGSRTMLLTHQVYIAAQVAQRHAPRVLLADEVGLGKTIEAGMIVHYQLYTGIAARVLLIVPETLLHQWLVEMLRRFNLHFSIFDESRLQALGETGQQNPFDAEQLIMCSLDFLLSHTDAHAQACKASWDLLVVDEAHHLYWSETETSAAYRCIEMLAMQSPGLLLLTATPEQTGTGSHFAHLRLLDPARFFSLSAFKQESGKFQELNAVFDLLLTREAEDVVLPDWLNEDYEYNTLSREKIIRQLLDRHGTGRVLFRNTRMTVQGFPGRCASAYPLVNPDIYSAGSADEDLSILLYPELRVDVDAWIKQDPRVVWLKDFLKDMRPSKVLVICAYAATAQALEHFLHLRAGIRSAAFHESLSIIERDRAAAYFADHEEGAQALICSEIGSEGRNFQFAQHLVLFDLPLNPDLLEQRIGRLDRIGQQNEIHIHIPYLLASAQEVLYRWYEEGLNAFARSCSVGCQIYEQFAERLGQQLRHPDNEGLNELIAEGAHATAALLQTLQLGRDRVLELSSCDREEAQRLIDAICIEEKSTELHDYMARVFDVYGVEYEDHSEYALVLHPSDHMRSADFPGLKEDGNTVVFDRGRALQREDMEFLSWEHPMVSDAMAMLIHSELGNATLATIQLPEIVPGSLLLETVYTIEAAAPKALQVERYMPLSPLRFVVDMAGREYSHILPPFKVNALRENISRSTALAVTKKIRNEVDIMLAHSDRFAREVLPGFIAQADARMRDALESEVCRLQALKKINPSIRDSEITFLQLHMEAAHAAIARAGLRLQAIRLLISI